jgi:P2 family phage contractile tail tube protein
MAVRTPEKISAANVFIDVVGHLGVVEEVKLPEVKQKLESVNGGGIERDIQTGIFEKMEAEINLDEYSSVVYSAMANNMKKGEPVTFICKANIVQGGVKKGVVVTIAGDITVNDNSLKGGETAKRTVHVSVRKYVFEVDGKQEVMIDVDNLIGVIDGVDVLEELRKNLM